MESGSQCSYLHNNFVTAQVLEKLFPILNVGKNCEVFPGVALLPSLQSPQLFLKQTTLNRLKLASLRFFPTCNILTIIDLTMQIFLTSGTRPD